MKRILVIGFALLASTLGWITAASARLGMAPIAVQDDAVIQVRGHGMAMAMAICIVADVVTITDGAGAADITTAGVIIVITTSCRLH